VKIVQMAERPEPPCAGGSKEGRLAAHMLRCRGERDRLLGPDLFGEPAWTILLTLFLAFEEGRPVSTAAMCAAKGAPIPAERWLRTLEAEGKIILDGAGRDETARLSPETAAALRTLLHSWAQTAA